MQDPHHSDQRGTTHGPFEQIHEDPHPDVRQPPGLDQLVQQIRETADKLLRDHATRGDVKLLNTALKELRYSFKVFSAFREQRKVTVRAPRVNAPALAISSR